MRTLRQLAIDVIEEAQDMLILAKDDGKISSDQFTRVMDALLGAKVDLICRES